jgi:transcriptional regulator with XRE-family HTH domain
MVTAGFGCYWTISLPGHNPTFCPWQAMNDEQLLNSSNSVSLASRIARLVKERGWNQEEFARIAGLNRQTVRQIMMEGSRTLRNSTVSACAKALGVTVNDLLILPLDRLLVKMNDQGQPAASSPTQNLLDRTIQPELRAWIERNPERAAEMTPDEAEELLDMQQESGGPLASVGVEHFVEIFERRRRIVDQVLTIAATEYIDLLEQLVGLIHEKVQPYRDRA